MAVFVVADPARDFEAAPSSDLPAAPSAILARLRLETRGEHDTVERVLDLMGASLTREGYRQRLEQFYGFYAALEAALQSRCAPADGCQGEPTLPLATRSALLPRLTKAARLRQDLHHLGVMSKDVPLCRELPPLETQAEVLGCLYVLEGATLGGRMITQHVRATLGITPASGGSFFDGYGDDTGKMWQAMRQLLVKAATDTQTENTIVANAMATFACLRCWCESRQNLLETETHRHA